MSKSKKPNWLIRSVLLLSGYTWDFMAVSDPFSDGNELIVISKRTNSYLKVWRHKL